MLNRRSAMLAAAIAPLAAAWPSGAGAGNRAEIFVPAQRAWSSPPPQAAVTSGLAKLSNTSLFYWDTGGHGEPVVFLHPFTGSHETWLYQQPVFAAAGYRVIGYSRRGFYRSAQSSATAGGTDAEDLRDLLALLGVGRAHLVGSAAGGFTAMDFARRWPEALRTLTIASSLAGASPVGGKRPDLQFPAGYNCPPPFGS